MLVSHTPINYYLDMASVYIVRTKKGIEILSLTPRQAFVRGAIPYTGAMLRPEYVSLLMRIWLAVLYLMPCDLCSDLENNDMDILRLACVETSPLPTRQDGVYAVIGQDGSRVIAWMRGIHAATLQWTGYTVLAYQDGVYQTI